MSENYNDKDIERIIFRDGLASGEIEPSEKFWNKAFEHIIQKENRPRSISVTTWRVTLLLMGTIIVALGCYAVYMHTQINDLKQQFTQIESTHLNTVPQDVNKSTVTTTTEKTSITKTLPILPLNNNIGQVNKVSAIANKTTANISPNKETGRSNNTYTRTSNNILAPAPRQFANSTPGISTVESTVNRYSSSENKKHTQETNTAATSTPINNSNSSNPSVSYTSPATIAAQTSLPQHTNSVSSGKKTDSSMVIGSTLDSINSLYIPNKAVTLAGLLSSTSISAFYAPGVTDDFLSTKDNDPTHTITAHQLKTRQDGDGTYAIGMHLAYDISDKWSIRSGFSYSRYSYSINPTILYAQQQENGQIGYSIATSSGTVFLPNSAGTKHIGDSIKVKGSSSRGYISIPLQANYIFATGSRLGFYVSGGFSVNIANYKETQIHWENTSFQEGDVTVQSIYGLNTVQYSYNLGVGAKYLIWKGLSIYAEPFLDGSFTSINKNTPVITYPYFFGLALGITYHF